MNKKLKSKKDTNWILGITRGHNGGVCLLKNGKVVFCTEEERYTRKKYDGAPLRSIMEVLKYTKKLDAVGIAHTQPITPQSGEHGKLEYTGENVFAGFLRKIGLISSERYDVGIVNEHPQIYDYGLEHHKLHAYTAFSKSNFDKAAILVVDGAGSFLPITDGLSSHQGQGATVGWEVETIFDGDKKRKNPIHTKFKSIGSRDPILSSTFHMTATNFMCREGTNEHEAFLHDHAGIVKTYEAVTDFCGWQSIEAGKTMGLFPYGKPNEDINKLFMDERQSKYWPLSDRNIIVPSYPNGATVNQNLIVEYSHEEIGGEGKNKYDHQLAKDLAYAVQTETQELMLKAIIKASEMCDSKNVVLTGGYALNCVANYFYLDKLNELGINLYVEPVSNDAGTALGAAIYAHLEETEKFIELDNNIYLGRQYNYSESKIKEVCDFDDVVLTDNVTNKDVVKLLKDRNIVTIFQGGCENGPRALGNRSILYDPTDPTGKDHINTIKHREFFRPFAGTILKEHVHEWFDLKGMEATPHMMYAVKCQPGIEEKIPAIIHVDGTCRIQTVTEEENTNYYNLIKEWYKQTGCPIIFNTSFNLGGEPLVETLEDAMRTLSNSDIEYLYLPEYKKLIYVKNNEQV